ncbi:hypothetical protein PV08_10471 [Exophiala spinifera]|uniref:Uncharacterized protein n=1 Tax=Exophiala spinifera TaxID=91928 RepID=A0A0D1Y865_9EURO|nr:uncharacterized protein PV08_10471 [Exophiala spinifera]KIW11171.1 hypothetical protein PV08_10471 [Exophiala spinifera]
MFAVLHEVYFVLHYILKAHVAPDQTKHGLTNIYQSDEEAYDADTLNYIRDTIYPLYSTVPEAKEERKSILKHVKVSTVSRPKPLWRRKDPTPSNITYTRNNKTEVEDDDDNDSLPIPVVTYVHGKGCVFSDSPDVVIKPADFVKAIDDLAKTRHDELAKMLEAKTSQSEQVPYTEGGRTRAVSTWTSSSDTESSSNSASSTHGSTVSETSTTSPTCTSTASWEEGSESKSVYYERRKAEKAKEDAELVDLMARLVAEETTTRVRNEMGRLQACMATSSLTKGLYFKRCNGMFRNALDDELLLLVPGASSASASASASHVSNTSTVQKGTEATKFKSDKSESSKMSTVATATTSTTTVDLAATVGGVAEIAPGATKVETCVGACTLSGAGYALLAHEENVPTSPTSSTYGDGDTDSDDNNGEKDMATFFAAVEHVRANPQLFKFTTPILMSREALVRDGKVEATSLEETSWFFNNLQRRVRLAPSSVEE